MKDSQLYCHMEYPIYNVDRLPTCSAPEGDCEFYISERECGYKESTLLNYHTDTEWVKPHRKCPFHIMKNYL